MAGLAITWLDATNKVAIIVGSGAPTNGWSYGAGSQYIDTATGAAYRYDGVTWTGLGGGAAGPTGATGPAGAQGVQGAAGNDGNDGISIVAGDGVLDEAQLLGLSDDARLSLLLSQG